jgi:hypothetical protein
MKTDAPGVHYAQTILESGEQRKIREGTGTVYRIVVRDELSERYAAAFEGMEVETRCGQTILTGEVVDQPQLHGILDRIGGLGLKLISIEAAPGESQGDK